jgi:hypothetical protein
MGGSGRLKEPPQEEKKAHDDVRNKAKKMIKEKQTTTLSLFSLVKGVGGRGGLRLLTGQPPPLLC